MSTERFEITATDILARVEYPGGCAADFFADGSARDRFAFAAIRQQARNLDQLRADLAAAVGRSSSLERTIAALQMRLRRAGQLLIEEIGACGPEDADDIADRAAGLIRKQADTIAALSSQLGNLLAVIHRDGGHYESEHGTEKACADAELAVHVQRGIADWYHDALKIWRQRAEQAEARLDAIDGAPTVAIVESTRRGSVVRFADNWAPFIGSELIARQIKDKP